MFCVGKFNKHILWFWNSNHMLLLTSLTVMWWLYFWERPWHALMFDQKGGVKCFIKKVNSLPFEKVRKASEHKVQHVKHWAEQFYAIQDVRDPRQADASEWPCSLTSDRHWSWKSHTEGLRRTFYDAHQSNEQPWGYCTVYGWPRPDLHLIRKGTTIPFSPPPPPSLTEMHSFPWRLPKSVLVEKERGLSTYLPL